MKERVRAWSRWAWSAAANVSIRAKIMGIVLGLVLVLGLGVTLQVRATMGREMRRNLEELGIAVARDLAARSTDLILTNNLFALHELLRDTGHNTDDLRYAFVLDADGRILAHTFGQGVPPALIGANQVRADERYHGQVLDTEEGLIHDFAVPIFEGRAGRVRVGISENRLRGQMAATIGQLLLTTLLASVAGLAGGYALTGVLTRPVKALVEVTRAVGRGDLSRRAPQRFGDEIGTLGASFNVMLNDLERTRQESEAFNRRLLRRNQELSALNSIAQAVGGPLNLGQVMEQALEQVLSIADSHVGWICLVNDDTCRVFAATRGMPRPKLDGCSTCCACGPRLETAQPTIIECPAENCALASAEGGPARHIAVPLSAKGRLAGVLNIACQDDNCILQEEARLLSAIGRQLGVAIENARLWEEVQRKEALRGELLGKVISAQEEERKRIARELHDETGQSLTSLLIGLTALESGEDLDQVRAGVRDLRAIVSATLESVHDLATELRPSVLDDLGLVAALQRYTREYGARFRIGVDLQTVGLDGLRFGPQVEITLYRIVQEAMFNAARHAKARQVSVLLERRASALVAVVEDDGNGFDVSGILNTEMRHRLGLYGMEERATLLGGRLTIESTPGTGTAVFVEVPL